MIVKKLIAAIVTFTMLITCIQPCFAATMDSATGYVPNPMNMELGLEIAARKSGELAYTNDGFAFTLAGETGAEQVVDYLATLNMGGIRSLFSKAFITKVLGNKPELSAEFNNGTVSTTINVAITYPAAAVIAGGADSLKDAGTGVLKGGTTFTEAGQRTLEGNTLTITYKNADNLKVEDLDDSIDGQLKDITFELADKISYKTEGTHTVTISLTGSTTVTFDSKTQVINYTGTTNHIANVSKDVVHHVLKVVPVVPATCGSTGMTEGIICETHNGYNCGAKGTVEPQQTPELPHPAMADGVALGTIVHVDEVLATCTNTGMYEHYTCVLCKQDFDTAGAEKTHEQLTIAKTAHNAEGILAAQAATCTEEGHTQGIYCTDCGTVSTRQTVTSALGHSTQVNPAQAATCTDDGYTEETVCGRCGVVLIPKTVLTKTGHKFGEWQETTAATPTSEGEMKRTCQNSGCSEFETKSIPKLVVHTCKAKAELAVVTTAPTCTAKGSKQNYCECGLPVGAPVDIPAIGHSLTKVDGVAATCTKTGIVEHYACANCGQNFRDRAGKKLLASVTAPIAVNAHNDADIIDVLGVAPTCVTPGLTAGKKCKLCNAFIKGKEQRSIKETGHVMETVGYAATCTTTGVKEHKHCVVCNKDFDQRGIERLASFFDTPALGHSYKDTVRVITAPQEGVEGQGEKECKRCDHKKIVTIAALAHVHNEIAEEIITPETCTTDGLKRKIYACCGEVIENNIVIPKHNHTLEVKVQIDSECHKKGIEGYYECTECHQLFDKNDRSKKITAPKEIDFKSHNFVDGVGYKECIHCHEKINYHYNNAPGASVGGHGGIKNDDDEERTNTDRVVKVESNIIIDKRDEISPKMDEAIPADANTAGKIVVDIVIEKVTEYNDTDIKDKEIISETDDLVEIIIPIPSALQDKSQYTVLRVHNGITQELTEDTNKEEYIVVDKTGWVIKLYVKKFSEYAVLVFNEDTTIDTPADNIITSGGGGGSSNYIVQFKANGGTVVNNVKVKSGGVIAAPVTTREGYIFKGWYTDMALTQLFDFSTPIKKNMILYAAWEEDATADTWFVDVPETEWFYEAIKYAYDNGLMNGVSTTHFAPNESVTRAMLVTVLWRAEGKPVATKDSTFKDLESGLYYVDAVKWAAENGIVNGYTDTEFAPNDKLAREQIAAIMFRYAGHKGYDVSAYENTDILSYTDYDQISEYAVPAMKWTAGSGLMTGRTNTTLNPKADTTRAEISTILYRFFATK